MKGRPLLPVLKTKKRYVIYELVSDKNNNSKDIVLAIKKSFKKNFGDINFGKSGFINTRIYRGNRGIIKINNNYLDHLKTAMTMITDVNGKEAIIKIIGVSGILKKAKYEYLRR